MCDEPADWCLHSGAHSKPKLCAHANGALAAGHWCTQGKAGETGSLSGFSPCAGPPPAGSAWPHGVCLDVEDGEALCPGHPHVKLSSAECPEPELREAAPPQAAPKPQVGKLGAPGAHMHVQRLVGRADWSPGPYSAPPLVETC